MGTVKRVLKEHSLMKGVLSMKKLISLILTLALCLTAVSAFAEAKTDFTAEQVTISIPENAEGLGKVELNGSAKALTSTDTVVKNGDVYDITTASGLKIHFDKTGLPYFVYTQSYFASIDIYSRYDDDTQAQSMIDTLIENNVHFLVTDAYRAFQEAYLRTLGSDSLTSHVRDLASLNENEVKAVASVLVDEGGEYNIYSINDAVWVQVAANIVVTIKNSEYVMAAFFPNGDTMTEDDYADFNDFVKAISFE